MRVRVHVKGIKGSGLIKPGEEPAVLFNAVLEIDGHLIDEVTEIEACFSGGNLVTVKPQLMPGRFEIVTHDQQSWPEMIDELDRQKKVYAGSGQVVVDVE